jgi:hypothetical protein
VIFKLILAGHLMPPLFVKATRTLAGTVDYLTVKARQTVLYNRTECPCISNWPLRNEQASIRERPWWCKTNNFSRALSCDTVQRFTSLARFVSHHTDEIEALYGQMPLEESQPAEVGG